MFWNNHFKDVERQHHLGALLFDGQGGGKNLRLEAPQSLTVGADAQFSSSSQEPVLGQSRIAYDP